MVKSGGVSCSQGSKPSKDSIPPAPLQSGKQQGLRNVAPNGAYCATTLQGATCVDNRCTYSHDVFHCKPCGRSFPASLLVQHQSSQQHLRSVAVASAANGPPNPSTPLSPLSQSGLLSAPTSNTSRPSGGNTPTPDEGPRVTVSDEGGLDFVAEGMGVIGVPSFPPVTYTITIEKTNVMSSLVVQSLNLTPSPSPWCE